MAPASRGRDPRGSHFARVAQALEDLESARILEMANTDLERIDAGGRRDFVEEALVAERILRVGPARESTPQATACRASQCAVSLLFGNA